MKNHSTKVFFNAKIKRASGKIEEIKQDFGNVEVTKLFAEVKDSNGNLKERKELPFDSYLKAVPYLINYLLTGESNSGKLLNTSGLAISNDIFQMKLNEGEILEGNTEGSLFGLNFGDLHNDTGKFPNPISGIGNNVNISDYALKNELTRSQIVSTGSTSGYNIDAVNIAVDTNKIKISRNIENADASSVLVLSEIGLTGKFGTDPKDSIQLTRDSIGTEICDAGELYYCLKMNPGDNLTIFYEITVSANSGFKTNYLKMLESLFTGQAVSSCKADDGAVIQTDYNDNTNVSIMAPANEKYFGLVLGGKKNKIPSGIPNILPNTCVFNELIGDLTLRPVKSNQVALYETGSVFTVGRKFENNTQDTFYVNHAGIIAQYDDGVVDGDVTLFDLPIKSDSANYIILHPLDILELNLNFVYPVGTMEVDY